MFWMIYYDSKVINSKDVCKMYFSGWINSNPRSTNRPFWTSTLSFPLFAENTDDSLSPYQKIYDDRCSQKNSIFILQSEDVFVIKFQQRCYAP